jgi:hypothetical protein
MRRFVIVPMCCQGNFELVYDADSGLYWLRCEACGEIDRNHTVTGPLVNTGPEHECTEAEAAMSPKPSWIDRLFGWCR